MAKNPATSITPGTSDQKEINPDISRVDVIPSQILIKKQLNLEKDIDDCNLEEMIQL